MTPPPASLLARVEDYPPAIRSILTRPVGPEEVAEHLTALHGDPHIPDARLRELQDEPPLTDAFLAQLLHSNRFSSRLDTLEIALAAPMAGSGADAARAAGHAATVLAPLHDPERPYRWKLEEVAERGDDEKGLTKARARAILALAVVARPAAGARSVAAVLARAMLGAAGDPAPCAAWAVAAGLEEAPKDTGSQAARDAALARLLARGLGLAALRPADRAAWEALPRGRGGAVAFDPARPLALARTGPVPEGAEAAWSELDGLFAPEAPARLEVPARLAPSPVLVAGLRATALGAGPRALTGPDPEDGPSWAAELEGHPDPRPAAELARLDAPGEAAPALETRAFRRAGDVPAGAEDPATAYAIVLRLEPEAPTGRWVNLDACHVLPGHGAPALEAARALARERPDAARRPVVLAGRNSPADPDWLTGAVARHWAQAGRHATAAGALVFTPETGRVRLDDRPEPQAARLLPAALAAVPLGLLAGDALVLRGPFLAVVEGAGASRPAPSLPLASREGLAADLAPDQMDDAARAAAMAAGPVTRALARRLDGPEHWAIEPLLARDAARHAALEARLDALAARPDAATAGTAMVALARPDTDAAALAAAEGRALVALAGAGSVLAAMTHGALETFLARARLSPRVDEIARALAVTGPEAMAYRPGLAGPLCDLWAIGLPEPALQAAWAALASILTGQTDAATASARADALTSTGHRHAGPEAMARLARALPEETLAKVRLLRRFRHLPDAPGWPTLARTLGPLAARIEAGRDARDAFATALAAGDAAGAQAALAGIALLDAREFTSWLDGLRGASAEIAALGLSVEGQAPHGTGPQRRKLMALLLGDRAALAEMEVAGLLGDGSELSDVALQHLGRPERLEARLAATWPDAPVPLAGGSAAEAFAAAAAATRPTRPGHEGLRVSVVVGAYDPDPEMLALSLGSLRAQGHRDLEILLVDDASGPAGRDAIAAACAADPEIRLIRMEENSGPYAGRNRAIAQSTGAFVAIQDADDWAHPDRIAAQLDAFAARPALQLVTTPHLRVDVRGLVQLEARFAALGDGPMTSMFRRSVFDRIGPFAPTRSRGDVEMRERVRRAMGLHAMTELPGPPMLCFAAASTLSQRVRTGRREALQLWRGQIDRRPSAWGAARDGRPPVALPVPMALRAPGDPAP